MPPIRFPQRSAATNDLQYGRTPTVQLDIRVVTDTDTFIYFFNIMACTLYVTVTYLQASLC